MTLSTGTPSFVNSYHSVGAGIIITCTNFKSLKLENSPSHLTTNGGFIKNSGNASFEYQYVRDHFLLETELD